MGLPPLTVLQLEVHHGISVARSGSEQTFRAKQRRLTKVARAAYTPQLHVVLTFYIDKCLEASHVCGSAFPSRVAFNVSECRHCRKEQQQKTGRQYGEHISSSTSSFQLTSITVKKTTRSPKSLSQVHEGPILWRGLVLQPLNIVVTVGFYTSKYGGFAAGKPSVAKANWQLNGGEGMKFDNFSADDTEGLARIKAPEVKFAEDKTASGSSSPEQFLSRLSRCVNPGALNFRNNEQSSELECERKAFLDKIDGQHRRILDSLRGINVYSRADEIVAALDNAINQAQKLNSTDIAKAREILTKELSVVKEERAGHATLVKMYEIVRKLDTLKRIEETESYLRMTRGVCRLQTNDIAVGRFDIDAALNWCEELAKDPIVVQKIINTGVPREELKQWFPNLTFDETTDKAKKRSKKADANLVTA